MDFVVSTGLRLPIPCLQRDSGEAARSMQAPGVARTVRELAAAMMVCVQAMVTCRGETWVGAGTTALFPAESTPSTGGAAVPRR